MPTTLTPFNVGTLSVGQSGVLDLTQATGAGGLSWGLPGRSGPTLRLHNESGTGLLCSFNSSGQSFYLTAGGWQDCYPRPGDSQLDFTVQYVLPNPPVTLLLGTYYGPGEVVPAITTLGNSPIGIGGTVNTVGGSATSVQNDNNPVGTQVIEATMVSSPASNLFADNQGKLVLQQYVSSVIKELLQVLPGTSPKVLIGDVGVFIQLQDSLAVLGTSGFGTSQNTIIDASGNLTVGGHSSFDNGLLTTDGAGNETFANNKVLNWKDSGGIARLVMAATNLNKLIIRAIAGNGSQPIQLQDVSGTTQLSIIDTSPQVTVANNLQVNGDLLLALGSISRISKFTASVTTTPTLFNHGLGAIPDIVLLSINGTSSTAASVQYDTATLSSTQVKLTGSAALAVTGLAIKF